MSNEALDPSQAIAERLRFEREARKWSLAELAEHSGVSKAMISKIERGESSPTMTVLGRLCGAFGLTISTFLTHAEGRVERLSRAADQIRWTDAGTGCVRTLISPTAGGPIELVMVELPAGAKVRFPQSLYSVFRQSIWVLEGELTLEEGDDVYELGVGDCFDLGPPTNCSFANASKQPCRYMVAASRRAS